MAPQRQRCLPELNEDVTAEILLRLPPDEPEHLIRAGVVCKLWLRIVSDQAFLQGYRAFHRVPPLLGFFYNNHLSSLQPFPGFVPTTTAAASPSQPVGRHSTRARWASDCRHGRVLLRDIFPVNFVVWDPLSNHCDELLVPWKELHLPDAGHVSHRHSNAVVLCAVAGCDHRSCHCGGPFHVVCVGVYHRMKGEHSVVLAHVYSSESRTWCTQASAQLDDINYFDMERGALIGDGIYFTVNHGSKIVKYDLVKHRLSMISAPPYRYSKVPVLMQNEDGSLEIAGVSDSRLHLWSNMANDNAKGVTGWVQRRVIKLEEILPDISSDQSKLIGFAEGVEVLFLSTGVGAFTFELKSGRVRKVGEPGDYRGVTPFISFFTPDRGCSKWAKESLPCPN